MPNETPPARDAEAPGYNQRLAERLAARLTTAADQLVESGMIGVAARLELPGRAEPFIITSGHKDLSRSAPLDGGELFAIASQSKSFTAAMTMRLDRKSVV